MSKLLDSVGLTKLVELIKGSLPSKATSTNLGLVKPDGTTTTVDSNGTLSATGGAIATTETAGTVIPDGTTITIDPETGVISSQGGSGDGTEYSAGSGISISDEGEISANLVGGSALPFIFGRPGYEGAWTNFGMIQSKARWEEFAKRLRAGELLIMQCMSHNSDGYEFFPRAYLLFSSGSIQVLKTAVDYHNANLSRTWYCALLNNNNLVLSFNSYNYFPRLLDLLPYTKGGLTATTVQNAIAELAASIPTDIPSLPDTPTTDGSYKLVNTITTDSETEEQSSELSWQEDSSSGGGVTYTAGPGIKITENNEIQKESLNNMLGYWIGALYYGKSMTDILRPVKPTSKDEAIALLKAGKIITGYEFSCTTDELVSNPTDPSSSFLSNILQVLTIKGSDGSHIFSRYMGTDTFTISSSLYSCLVGNLFIRFVDTTYLRNFIFRKMYYYKGSVTATTIPDAIYELATTRIADTLVSEETTPTVNNTINWLYE